MKPNRRQFIASSLLSAGALSLQVSAQDKTKSSAEAQTISLRGRVVCMTEELQKLYQVIADCDIRGHVYTLKTNDDKFYPFLPVDIAAAVWMDERYRQRDLQVTGRIFPQGQFIEVIRFQSWNNGKLHDLYYFCDVCQISSHKPGPCDCCQDPFQFRETPATEENAKHAE
ncbi:MAG: hypothetical protein L0226_00860 [Acidobacteria bacterium]|nr:hypothetical protein [Acidobacteriota bacterium]